MNNIITPRENMHVIPVDDWFDHSDSPNCKCRPVVRGIVGGTTIAHNSFDGREHLEADHNWRECPVCVSDLETTTSGW